mgnify:CR=1 FL=1
MKVQLFSDALGEIRAKYIDEALTYYRPTKYGTTKIWLNRCVAACLTLGVFFGAMIATSAPLRAAFVGWIKGVYETYFVYHYAEKANNSSSFANYAPTWVPHGYEKIKGTDSGGRVDIIYRNEAGQLLRFHYIFKPDETTVFVDAEGANVTTAVVGDHVADLILFEEPSVANNILWTDQNNSVFYISGFFNEDTLIRIAESVKEVSS